MNRRTFYHTSILIGVVALISAFGYQAEVASSQRLKIESIATAMKTHTQAMRDPRIIRMSHEANVLSVVATVICATSLVTLVLAAFRHERGWYSIPILLIFSTAIALMLLQ